MFTSPADNGVSSVTVTVTVSTLPFGVDASVSLTDTITFTHPVDALTAATERTVAVERLSAEASREAQQVAATVKNAIAAVPRGNTSVVELAAALHATAPSRLAEVVSGSDSAAVVALANGATAAAPTSGVQWASGPSRFGGEEIRYIPTSHYPTSSLKEDVLAQLAEHGIDAAAVVVFDDREYLEKGQPAGSIATVKVAKSHQSLVPADYQRNAIARAKFNTDGTVKVTLTRDFATYLRHSGAAALGGAA